MSSLSAHFSAIAFKRLSEVEINHAVSNQHEFNGVSKLKGILGAEKQDFETTFFYIADDENELISEKGKTTWYDARENHATRTEYRLYYTSNLALKEATTGDLLIVGKLPTNQLAIIIAPEGSTVEQQLFWLFGIKDSTEKFNLKDFEESSSTLGFAEKHILSTLGIDVEEEVPSYIDQLLEAFGLSFPTTRAFSEFTRNSFLKDELSPVEAPDETLMKWIEREELLFKSLERIIVEETLKEGFGESGTDVDAFIKFSLSVQNRRKSRAGHSLENHLKHLFETHKVSFSKGAKTEENNKPDFIFPSIEAYHDETKDNKFLTMLGVKTSAKDRWRQILPEANLIELKHLLTLEPAISENQTSQMIAQKVQLVIPSPIIPTFKPNQQKELLQVSDFLSIVKERQKNF